MSSTHAKKNFQMKTFREVESVNGFIPLLYMSSKLSEVCIYNLLSELWQSNRGNPRGDRDAMYICILPVGCVSAMHGLSMVTSRQLDSPIGGKGIPKLRTA